MNYSIIYYRYEIAEKSFHVFRKILISYPRFSGICWTDLHHFPASVFSEIDKIVNCQCFEIYKKNIFRNDPGMFLDLFKISWCLQKQKRLVLGAVETSNNLEIIEMKVVGFSHQQIEILLNQNGPEIFPRSFKAYYFHTFTIKIAQKNKNVANMCSYECSYDFPMN